MTLEKTSITNFRRADTDGDFRLQGDEIVTFVGNEGLTVADAYAIDADNNGAIDIKEWANYKRVKLYFDPSSYILGTNEHLLEAKNSLAQAGLSVYDGLELFVRMSEIDDRASAFMIHTTDEGHFLDEAPFYPLFARYYNEWKEAYSQIGLSSEKIYQHVLKDPELVIYSYQRFRSELDNLGYSELQFKQILSTLPTTKRPSSFLASLDGNIESLKGVGFSNEEVLGIMIGLLLKGKEEGCFKKKIELLKKSMPDAEIRKLIASSEVDFFDRVITFDDFSKKYFGSDGEEISGVNIEQMISDYNGLPPSERYLAFKNMSPGNNRAYLKKILAVDWDVTKIPGKYFLKETARRILERLEVRLGHSADVWEGRVAVVEETLRLEELVALYGELLTLDNPKTEGGRDIVVTLESFTYFKEQIRSKLVYLYDSSWVDHLYNPNGNPFWDSDGDVDPALTSAPVIESNFDDRDPRPLDWGIEDSDGDGVEGLGDIDDSDPNKWTSLAVGESYTDSLSNYNITIKRSSEDTFVISATIIVTADPESRDVEFIKRTYLNTDFLSDLKERVEKVFLASVRPGRFKFRFDVNFEVAEAHDDAGIILFTDRDVRSNSQLWDSSILSDEKTVLHELGHAVFGWTDYYNETLVSGEIRDYTLKPAYEVLGAKHLMSCASTPFISQEDLLDFIALTVRQEKYDSYIDMLRAYSSHEYELQYENKPLSAARKKRLEDQVNTWSQEIASGMKTQREIDILLLQNALVSIRLGKKSAAAARLTTLFMRNKHNEYVAREVVGLLIKVDTKTAVFIARYNYFNNEYDIDGAALFATALLKDKRYAEASKIAGIYLEKCLKGFCPYTGDLISAYTTSLAMSGNISAINNFIAKIPVDRKYLVGDIVTDTTKLLLRANKFREAEEFYWKYHKGIDILDYKEYISILESEVFQERKHNCVPICCLEKLYHSYEIVIADDSLDRDALLGYSVALFLGEKRKNGLTMLRRMVKAYKYERSSGLLIDLPPAKFIAETVDLIRKAGLEKKYQFALGMNISSYIKAQLS